MLELIRQVLSEQRLIDSAAELVFNIHVTTGATITAEVGDCDTGRWYHVKSSCHLDLLDEYQRFQAAKKNLGDLVVNPLAFGRAGTWTILVAESVTHRPLTARDLLPMTGSNVLWQGMLEFFSRSAQARAAQSGAARHHELLGQLGAFFQSDVPNSRPVLDLLDRLAGFDWESIPAIPQHGDCLLINFGTTHGRLIAFDWEDYGRVSLPGLDIFCLCMSLGGLTSETVDHFRTGRSTPGFPSQELVAATCAVTGISVENLRFLVPLYLIAFRFLKRNYGVAIRETFDRLIQAHFTG
jgi:hypothetical protein